MDDSKERSLADMRHQKEVNDQVIDLAEANELEAAELDEFGDRIALAFAASGEAPPVAAIDAADESIAMDHWTEDRQRTFNRDTRKKIAEKLHEQTGATTIGHWIQQVRKSAGLTGEQAAEELGLSAAAFRQIESGRMPVWRIASRPLVRFCRRHAMDSTLLLQWASIAAATTHTSAFGRIEEEGFRRTDALGQLAATSEASLISEFETWRRSFVSACDEA